MARAAGPQRAERLNRALQWLRQGLSPPETIARLSAAARISWRQAYRYVQQARGLKRPLPVGEAKVVFTVKLPRSLVDQLHRYAQTTGETLSEIVSRALWAVLRRGGGRG